ncbi:MAG: large conductance mechanosensitive channel protein MscL, partial [Clostridia bacterium]|nr:large conductance mechanosensitive channel protein MscL [Clostridia bacterium]
MRKFFKEFKAFISKGNVFDLAVGMIIATAFNKIVSSLVNDIIMPLVTYATGAADIKDLSIVLRVAEDGTELLWKYGTFLQYIIDFLIIAFSVFIMVKIVTKSRKKLEELGDLIELQSKKEYKQERKMIKEKAKQENRKFKEVWKEHEQEKKRLADEKAQQEAEEKARKEAEEKAN